MKAAAPSTSQQLRTKEDFWPPAEQKVTHSGHKVKFVLRNLIET